MDFTKTISSTPDPVIRYLNPIQVFKSLHTNRHLISQFARREISSRYKGSYLGILWSFLNPLAMVAVYALVFGVIFKAKWDVRADQTQAEFALTIFCGVIVFTIFSECLSRAPWLILAYPNYVKKVIFPLEVLPVAVLVSSLVHAILGLAALLTASLILGQSISLTVCLFPVVLLPVCALTLGLSWFIASLGVFIRDIGHPLSMVIQMLFFVSGIFFPITAVPPEYRFILEVNPLTPILEDARRVVMWGQYPDWTELVGLTLICLIIMQAGFAWFMRSKRAFADVL